MNRFRLVADHPRAAHIAPAGTIVFESQDGIAQDCAKDDSQMYGTTHLAVSVGGTGRGYPTLAVPINILQRLAPEESAPTVIQRAQPVPDIDTQLRKKLGKVKSDLVETIVTTTYPAPDRNANLRELLSQIERLIQQIRWELDK